VTAGRLSRIVEMKAIYPQILAKLQSFPYGAYMFKKEKKKKRKEKLTQRFAVLLYYHRASTLNHCYLLAWGIC